MPPKRLKQNMDGSISSAEPQSTYKAKPKPYIEQEWLTKYKHDRDRILWKTADEETKLAIKEKYGF